VANLRRDPERGSIEPVLTNQVPDLDDRRALPFIVDEASGLRAAFKKKDLGQLVASKAPSNQETRNQKARYNPLSVGYLGPFFIAPNGLRNE
jgi:hypothetical protein